MKYLTILALCALLLLTACQSGPASDCDDCATGEVSAAAPFGQAAAAGARGGQDASQQPYNRDTARINPLTTVGRGAGPTTSTADMNEVRELASGGATNISFVPSVTASASNGGGSVSPAVLELRETIQDMRERARQAQAMGDKEETARLDTLIKDALANLMVASADSAKNVTINYNWQNSRNQMTGFSTSKTGRQPENPETAKALAGAAAESTKTLFSGDYEDAPTGREDPGAPPVPVEGDPR